MLSSCVRRVQRLLTSVETALILSGASRTADLSAERQMRTCVPIDMRPVFETSS